MTSAVGTSAVGTSAVGTSAVGTSAIGTSAVVTSAVGICKVYRLIEVDSPVLLVYVSHNSQLRDVVSHATQPSLYNA